MWAVVGAALPLAIGRGLGVQLDHAALPCPARGLEPVLARFDRHLPEVQLNLGEMPDWTAGPDGPRRKPASHWFVLGATVAGETAIALRGPPPADSFPPVPRFPQLAAIRRSLALHRRYAPGVDRRPPQTPGSR